MIIAGDNLDRVWKRFKKKNDEKLKELRLHQIPKFSERRHLKARIAERRRLKLEAKYRV